MRQSENGGEVSEPALQKRGTEKMEWVLIGVLGIIIAYAVTLQKIYWRSLSETRAVTNYLLAMTLHSTVYQSQRENLAKFIMMLEAKNPTDLKIQVSLRTEELAQRLEGTMTPIVVDRLWKLRSGELKFAPPLEVQ